jgi:predicted DNA-binding antitoxin AbrB/MazE fold protein
MSSRTVDAIYEGGILRLSRPIDLADGTRVEVVVTPRRERPAEARPAAWDVLDELASMPAEAGDRTLHGRDHDRVLYGGDQAP